MSHSTDGISTDRYTLLVFNTDQYTDQYVEISFKYQTNSVCTHKLYIEVINRRLGIQNTESVHRSPVEHSNYTSYNKYLD